MLKSILKKFEDMNDTVTQDMLVGDIVRLHPEVVDTLLAQGMHCLGCPRLRKKVSPMPAWCMALIRKKSQQL